LKLLKQHQRIALTCFEANICQCHRKHLAEALENLPGFTYEVEHIKAVALTKVLITVKTYTTLSGKYEYLVCTAGIFLRDCRDGELNQYFLRRLEHGSPEW
jgi:hypothetical protein